MKQGDYENCDDEMKDDCSWEGFTGDQRLLLGGGPPTKERGDRAEGGGGLGHEKQEQWGEER